MAFLDALAQGTNTARTENNAITNRSTLDPVLDFFSRAGAMRGREDMALELFNKAYAVDSRLAIKALFYLRDIRGGQGERSIFRHCLNVLATDHPATAGRLIGIIGEYGRWDDLLVLLDTPLKSAAVKLIKGKLADDMKGMEAGASVSLLAKWLPSEHTSSKTTQDQALTLIAALEMKPSEYRHTLVALRKHIKLLEQQMSTNQWEAVDYEKLPGQALRKHIKAFRNHDSERFTAYLEAAANGEKKMNTSTIYTYEVYEAAVKDPEAANAMWASLPDYTNGTPALVMADVSGSMLGRPMAVSVSLALYFAQRNVGPFQGCYMTFTDVPRLVQIPVDASLNQLMHFIENEEVGYNTNLEAAFNAILDAAVVAKAEPEQLPSVLYIISDMEFDQQMGECQLSNFESAERRFSKAGFKLPHVVFWNVDARNNQSPATKFDNRVTLISGLSPSTFRYAVEGKSPVQSMLDILNSSRYAPIEKILT